jgi:hypothetical protein
MAEQFSKDEFFTEEERLRRRGDFWAKGYDEKCKELDLLKQDVVRYENARIVLGLELTNLRERLARAEEERDDYKLQLEAMLNVVRVRSNGR